MTPTTPVVAILLGLSFATPVLASDPPTTSGPATPQSGTVHRLSPEEVKRILAEAAEKPRSMSDEAGEPAKKVHGEMGVMIGTGGARAAYGSAVIPLGDRGVAAFSFETGRYPGYGNRGHRGTPEAF